MAPALFDGDHLPIELGMKPLAELRSNDLYVVYDEHHMLGRRVAFEANGFIHILSTNQRYPNETIHYDAVREIRVLGKVRLREKDQLVGAFTAKIVEG